MPANSDDILKLTTGYLRKCLSIFWITHLALIARMTQTTCVSYLDSRHALLEGSRASHIAQDNDGTRFVTPSKNSGCIYHDGNDFCNTCGFDLWMMHLA
mmetsp:Transcript_5139/g.8077  ORF Transcript_5139/g.8077 Transcript_5139/m.8077 type:complete len:99 (+) Transcript_5139:206-502(+)